MKKKCFAALSGIILAISIIAPFSFSKVSAAGSTNLFTVYSFNRGSSRTYMYEDIYLVSGDLLRNYVLTIIVNDNFRNDAPNSLPYTSGVIECDGDYNIAELIASSGSGTSERRKYTYTITLNDVSYFHFQVVNYGTNSFWDANAGSPGYWMAVTIMQPSSYQVGSKKSIYSYLAQILNAIQNGGSGGTVVDLSGIESQLDNLIDLMDLNLAYDYDINNKLDILINLLSAQSSNVQDIIDNNDNANNQAQDVIDNYDNLTSTFESDFIDSQEEMNTIMENNSLSQFSSAMIWFTTQLGFLYESLGDMKILIILPLLLGIALFFIGRGNVIFRNPNTFTEQDILSESYYDKDSGFTSTKTYTTTHRRRIK